MLSLRDTKPFSVSGNSIRDPRIRLNVQRSTFSEVASEDEGIFLEKDSLSSTPTSPNDDNKYNNLILATLLAGFACNQWSRQALYYLCDFSGNADPFKHINAALSFTSSEYAQLASFGFTTTFAICSFLAGYVADTFNRKQILSLSCIAWSVLTGLNGVAESFQALIPLRALLGVSQSLYNPAAYTLLSDIFPKRQLGTVNGIYSSGIYLGGALASLTILFDGHFGWRNSMYFIAIVGLVLGLLTYTIVPEPRESNHTTATTATSQLSNRGYMSPPSPSGISLPMTILNGFREVTSTFEAKLLLLASTLRFCAGFTIVIWKAPFFFEKFPAHEGLFASTNAVVVAVGGFLSSLLGGLLSDYLISRGRKECTDDSERSVLLQNKNSSYGSLHSPNTTSSEKKVYARMWVPTIGSLLAAPLWAGFIYSNTPEIALAFLFGKYLLAESWFGPTLSTLLQVVPVNRKGSAQGLFSFLTALGNIAPVLVAYLTAQDNLPWIGKLSLDDTLAWFVSGCLLLSGILFGMAARLEQQRIVVDK